MASCRGCPAFIVAEPCDIAGFARIPAAPEEDRWAARSGPIAVTRIPAEGEEQHTPQPHPATLHETIPGPPSDDRCSVSDCPAGIVSQNVTSGLLATSPPPASSKTTEIVVGSAVTVPVSVAVTVNCTVGVAPPVAVTTQVNESTAAGSGAAAGVAATGLAGGLALARSLLNWTGSGCRL